MSTFLLLARPASGVLLVTLNRPAKLNALSVALVVDLAATLDTAKEDDAIRCVVLTGSDRAFSSGADIADQQLFGTAAVFGTARLDAWRQIQDFPKPLVAAVNGYALGGGNELAMLADIVVAGDTAQFGQPEINLGILPGDGATQRLVRSVGKSCAMQMILSGARVSAAEALRMGLVSEVVPAERTVERAVALAAVIAGKSADALKLAKAAVLRAYETTLAEGLAFERAALAEAFEACDRREGMDAFLAKRPADFG